MRNAALFPILIALLTLLAPVSREARAQAEMQVYNYTTDFDIYINVVKFKEGGPDIIQSPLAGDSLEIAYQRGPSFVNRYGDVGIQFATNSLYRCLLWYGSSTIPDNTYNSLLYLFDSPFPSNVLLTCLVQDRLGAYAVDLRKAFIEQGVLNRLELPLGTIQGATVGMEYATNTVHFAPVRTEVTQIAATGDTSTVTLTASAYPGTILWPRYCERLADGFESGTNLTNLARYVEAAVSNFAAPVAVTWTNLPAPATNGFYRLSGSPYDDHTRHLVD